MRTNRVEEKLTKVVIIKSSVMHSSSTFRQQNVFPVIARLLKECYKKLRETNKELLAEEVWVTHDRIVDSILADETGKILLTSALSSGNSQDVAIQQRRKTSNMVAWFCHKFTTENSGYENDFRRIKIRKKWAYQPQQ